MKKSIFLSALVALLVTCGTLGVYNLIQNNNSKNIRIEHVDTSPAKGVAYTVDEQGDLVPLDFTKTAANVVTAVVNIKSTQTTAFDESPQAYNQDQLPDLFQEFFGPRFRFENPEQGPGAQPRVGTGSGVIINENGYIVTNNHVIRDADDLEVTLNDNRIYKATVIGTDPTTDLALIKIEEKDLPTIPLVNSDEVEVGEWVLAVGNPFRLNSTVTAGIVSAKGRNINILQEQFAVESFIQTDAAINPGNSGGALVSLNGGLVGINTAIASPTGAYSGYGFAVPSNIVNKVVEDLLEYGVVQRGVLGVMIRDVNGNLAKEKELNVNDGVYVEEVMEKGAAGSAGLKKGDVITSVDGTEVSTSPELQEIIARHRPGDKVKVTVNREGKEKTYDVTLINRDGTTDIVKKENKAALNVLGADFRTVEKDLAKELDIDGGVQVAKMYAGKLSRETQMKEGFIITHVDGKKVTSVDELLKTLEGKKGGVMLEGVYENASGTHYYAIGM